MKIRLIGLLCTLAILAAGCGSSQPGPTSTPAPPTPTPYGDKLTPVAAAASTETAFGAANVIDGLMRTRWRPTSKQAEWVYVDLGATFFITRVTVHWHPGAELAGSAGGNAHGDVYDVQVSDDAENWTSVRSITDGDEETPIDDFTGFDTSGRYVRVYITKVSEVSGQPDNIDIFEIEVYGEAPSGD